MTVALKTSNHEQYRDNLQYLAMINDQQKHHFENLLRHQLVAANANF